MLFVLATLIWVAGSGGIGYVISRPRISGSERPPGWEAGREKTVAAILTAAAVSAFVLALTRLTTDASRPGGWFYLGAAVMGGGAALGAIALRRRRMS